MDELLDDLTVDEWVVLMVLMMVDEWVLKKVGKRVVEMVA